MKIKSHKLTVICMSRRDELRASAIKLMEAGENAMIEAEKQCEEIMDAAKKAFHISKIQSNRMNREADAIQEALNEELELQVKEQKQADDAWSLRNVHNTPMEIK